MRPTINFLYLHKSARRRLRYLNNTYASRSSLGSAQQNALLSFCVVELDNIIINLHREFLVSALSTKCVTCGGAQVTHNQSLASSDEAMLYVMSVLEPNRFKKNYKSTVVLSRRDETKIRDPLKLQTLSIDCRLSNYNSIVNALSLNSTVFAEIAVFRNFYAHRNSQTAKAVFAFCRNLGIATVDDAWDAVTLQPPGRPLNIYQSWITDLSNFAELLLD
ncbi:hypothetical protein [Methylobacterium sp. Leaf102]|uniref:hypothetical protein n=1 Tax=Methylobacterium sp. Leaf102 TaxID=1736253 RepID=UPI000A7E4D8B|nr:hypothetical protein [Methylobacterium sp. Leaf102]